MEDDHNYQVKYIGERERERERDKEKAGILARTNKMIGMMMNDA